MKSLADIQAEMQRAILNRTPGAENLVAEPPAGERKDRLSVYQAAYRLRLAEFLRNDFENLHTYLGDVRFNRLAESYIKAHPSDQPNARWYSRHLPDHLRRDTAYRRNPEVAELAALELALNDAFDGPDSPVCTMADLAAIDPEDFAFASFTLAPSVHCLTVTTNVTSLWASLKCGEKPPAPQDLDQAQEILVWRQSSGSRFRILGNEEAMALTCARDGLSFGVICEMIAAYDDPDGAALRAAGYLRGWLEAEIIACISYNPIKP